MVAQLKNSAYALWASIISAPCIPDSIRYELVHNVLWQHFVYDAVLMDDAVSLSTFGMVALLALLSTEPVWFDPCDALSHITGHLVTAAGSEGTGQLDRDLARHLLHSGLAAGGVPAALCQAVEEDLKGASGEMRDCESERNSKSFFADSYQAYCLSRYEPGSFARLVVDTLLNVAKVKFVGPYDCEEYSVDVDQEDV